MCKKIMFLWSVFGIIGAIVMMIILSNLITTPLAGVMYSIFMTIIAVGLGFSLESVLKDYRRDK